MRGDNLRKVICSQISDGFFFDVTISKIWVRLGFMIVDL